MYLYYCMIMSSKIETVYLYNSKSIALSIGKQSKQFSLNFSNLSFFLNLNNVYFAIYSLNI